MKSITTFLYEAADIDTKQQFEKLDELKTRHKQILKPLADFFNVLNDYRGSTFESPMRNKSFHISLGVKKSNNNEAAKHYEDLFAYYDYIFIKTQSKEKYAIYFDNESHIAICKDMKISYDNKNKDKASFLQDDGTYGKLTHNMVWLDVNSEIVKQELNKF